MRPPPPSDIVRAMIPHRKTPQFMPKNRIAMEGVWQCTLQNLARDMQADGRKYDVTCISIPVSCETRVNRPTHS